MSYCAAAAKALYVWLKLYLLVVYISYIIYFYNTTEITKCNHHSYKTPDQNDEGCQSSARPDQVLTK